MTDKAMVQIPAISDGVVTKLYYQQGEIAKVHEPLFAISSASEAAAEATPAQAVTEQSWITHLLKLLLLKRQAASAGAVEDFLLPDIGEGIVECEIVEWLVEEGQTVKEDQEICEVMTDKAMVQIPAKSDGVIEKLYYQKGEIAKVHEPLFSIRTENGSAAAPVQAVTSAPQATAAESN